MLEKFREDIISLSGIETIRRIINSSLMKQVILESLILLLQDLIVMKVNFCSWRDCD